MKNSRLTALVIFWGLSVTAPAIRAEVAEVEVERTEEVRGRFTPHFFCSCAPYCCKPLPDVQCSCFKCYADCYCRKPLPGCLPMCVPCKCDNYRAKQCPTCLPRPLCGPLKVDRGPGFCPICPAWTP